MIYIFGKDTNTIGLLSKFSTEENPKFMERTIILFPSKFHRYIEFYPVVALGLRL